MREQVKLLLLMPKKSRTVIASAAKQSQGEIASPLSRGSAVLPRNDVGGFLLLEVLVAIIIVATTLIVINRAFSTALRAVKLSGDYVLASCVLEDSMFDIQIEESFVDIELADTIELNNRDFYSFVKIAPLETTDEKDIEIEELPLKIANLRVNWQDVDNDTEDLGRLNFYTYVWKLEE